MEHFNQEQLANLLKFSTGSARTPIHGFKQPSFNLENYKAIEETSQNLSFNRHSLPNIILTPKDILVLIDYNCLNIAVNKP